MREWHYGWLSQPDIIPHSTQGIGHYHAKVIMLSDLARSTEQEREKGRIGEAATVSTVAGFCTADERETSHVGLHNHKQKE